MSVRPLSTVLFEDHPVTALDVRGRPAWPVPQVASALGYDGDALLTRMTCEWRNALVPGHDYTVLVQDDLVQVRRVAPELVSDNAPGLPALFESGLLVVTAKTAPELGLRLRTALLGDRAPIVEPRVTTEFDLRLAREQRLARVIDYHDRRLKYGAVRLTAIELHAGGFIDAPTYRALLVRACELALGAPLHEFGPTDDWSTVAQIAERTGAPPGVVLAAAGSLRLLEDRRDEVRPFPVREGKAWRVSFAFAPRAAAELETLAASRVAHRAALQAA